MIESYKNRELLLIDIFLCEFVGLCEEQSIQKHIILEKVVQL